MRTVLRAARQALLSQLNRAVAGLKRHSRTDRAVHEIRKELKGARATLRLLRDSLGAADYRWDNHLIRDAARPLTPLRDTQVLLESFERWTRDGSADQASPGIDRLGGTLHEEHRAAWRQLSPTDLDRAAEVLSAIRRRAAALTPRQLARSSPAKALKRAYKSARKTFRRAQQRKTDERLHEWRKQTKYFASQLELLLPFNPPKNFVKAHKFALRLAERLGEDHDLALLTQHVAQHAAPGGAADGHVESLTDRLAQRRRKLQRKCFRLGERLYRGKADRYPW